MENDLSKKIKPVSVGFNEKWNHAKLGMAFDKPVWDDPLRRTEMKMTTHRKVYERFGDVGLGEAEPRPDPTIDAYGHRFMGALYGCDIVYLSDQAPCALTIKGDYDTLARFDVPDFNNSRVMNRAWDEVALMQREYGFCYGTVNMGSPLNVAVTTFGELFLSAVAEEPELAQHVLRVVMETQFKLYEEFQRKVEPERYPEGTTEMGYGNCPAIMLSPSMYREVVLPVDKEYRSRCDIFHLHHCGIFDRYAEMYTELSPNNIDIGAGSDYGIMRQVFPDTRASLIIDPSDVEGRSREQIDAHLSAMAEAARPYELTTHMWTADFSPGMTDENIRDLATAHLRIQ